MSDILVKGAEMPESCAGCFGNHNMFCVLAGGKTRLPDDYLERPNACPSMELQPHGDLIDLSAKVSYKYYDTYNLEWSVRTVTVRDVLCKFLEEMPPVIIPANKED